MSYEWGPWIGASGFEHTFHVYKRGEAIPPRLGLYIYCRKDASGTWLPIYMGQGDLSVCCSDPELLACIDRKGATHIHMRLCASADERADELVDLMKRCPNTFAPEGCNVVAPETDPAVEPPAPA